MVKPKAERADNLPVESEDAKEVLRGGFEFEVEVEELESCGVGGLEV